MLLMTSHHPQRSHQSRPRVLCAFIEAKRRAFTDGAAEGRPRQRLDTDSDIWNTAPYMETFSTRQAAKMLGIGASTLSRYIAAGKIPVPKAVQVGGMSVHLWTERAVERVRKLLPEIEDGRTTRHQKQARKRTKTTS